MNLYLLVLLLVFSSCKKYGMDITDFNLNLQNASSNASYDDTVEQEEEQVDTLRPEVLIDQNPSLLNVDNSQTTIFTISIDDLGGAGLADDYELVVSEIELETLTGDATCATTTVVNGTTQSPTIELSNCTGNGTVAIKVLANAIADKASNNNLETALSTSINVINNNIGLFTIDTFTQNWVNTLTPTIEWQVATLALNYDVQVATTSGCVTPEYESLAQATLDFTIPGGTPLTEDTNYYVCVVAKDALFSRPATNTNYLFKADVTRPTATVSAGPTNTLINNSGSTAFTITLADTGGSGLAAAYQLIPAEITVTTASGNATCSGIAVTNGTTLTPTVTLSSCTGDGTVTISVNANAVSDVATNTNLASAASTAFTVDNTAPGAFSITALTDDWTNTLTPTIAWGASAGASTYRLWIDNTTACASPEYESLAQAGLNYVIPGGTPLTANTSYYVCVRAIDLAGNTTQGTNNNYTFKAETTKPTATVSAGPTVTLLNSTASTAFTVTLADTGGSGLASGYELTDDEITVTTATGTATCATVGITNGTTATPTVTLSDCTGNGTVTINVDASAVSDVAGNTNNASAASTAFTVDNTVPTVTFSSWSIPQATSASTNTIDVTFADTAGFSAQTLVVGEILLVDGDSTCNLVGVALQAGHTYRVTIDNCTGDSGSVRIHINAAAYCDQAGNCIEEVIGLPVVAVNNSVTCNAYLASTSHTDWGSGTKADPYKICTAAQLASIGATSSDWDKHYLIMRNISVHAYTEVSDGTMWTMIGNTTTPFTGVFDGNNFVISNFSYTHSWWERVAFFGYVRGGNSEIKNLGIENGYIGGGGAKRAILAAHTDYGTKISNCYVTGTVYGGNTSQIGGLVGFLSRSVVSSSYSTAYVYSYANNSVGTGGLIGNVFKSYVYNSYATGDVVSSVTGSAGGLIGGGDWSGSSIIISSYATGNVRGVTGNIGGLVGVSLGMKIKDSFSTGNVTGGSATATVGCVVGLVLVETTYENVFCNSDSVITNTGVGGINTIGRTGSGSDLAGYFKDSSNLPLSNFDTTNIWTINPGEYPILTPSFLDEIAWNECADHLVDVPFAGGVGTFENPFLICTGAQWQAIGADTANWVDKHFMLKDHIDLGAYTGTDYNIIGNSTNHFVNGSIRGEGYTISNLTYSNGTQDYVGLFGYTRELQIYRLGIEDINITGRDYVGTIAGVLGGNTSLIGDSYIKNGDVIGRNYIGGLVGAANASNTRSEVFNFYSTVDVTASGAYVADIHPGPYFLTINTIVVGNVQGHYHLGTIGIYSSYYDSNLSCINTWPLACFFNGGTAIDVGGVAPADYFFVKTNPPLSSWNFNQIWQENAGDYPTLRPVP